MNNYFKLNYSDLLPNKDATILDFGCGSGDFLNWLGKEGFGQLYAHDKNPVPASMFYQPWKMKPLAFDYLICRQVLYYAPNPLEFLQGINSNLIHRGRLLLEVFNGVTLTSQYIFDKDPDIKHRFNEHSLRGVLEKAGFHILAMRCEKYVNPIWHKVRWAYQRLLEGIYFFERGSSYNPTLFGKNIIVLAEKL